MVSLFFILQFFHVLWVGIMEPEYIQKLCTDTVVVYRAWSDRYRQVL